MEDMKMFYKAYVYTKNRVKAKTACWRYNKEMDKCYLGLAVTNRIITKTSEHNHLLDRSVGYVQMSLDKMATFWMKRHPKVSHNVAALKCN